MLELLKYCLSGGLFHFIGCVLVICLPILCIGWSFNALFLGIKGKRVDNPLD